MENIIRMEQIKRPWVVAHRGYRGLYPENTFAAFEGAIAAGADMVELDVCLTRDRVPVVIHDTTLYRTWVVGSIRPHFCKDYFLAYNFTFI